MSKKSQCAQRPGHTRMSSVENESDIECDRPQAWLFHVHESERGLAPKHDGFQRWR